jgi:hypothetical protein
VPIRARRHQSFLSWVGLVSNPTAKQEGLRRPQEDARSRRSVVMIFAKPKPGWRMFGRFYSQDVFVGLSCVDRHDCEPDAVYQQRAEAMIAQWEARLAREPLRGDFYETYLSNPTGMTIRNRDEP